jgi:hypothetical protein
MYRELGHNGLFLAMRAGPYTGPSRTFPQRAMPPYLLLRLRGILEGTALPSPILKREAPDTRAQGRVRLGLAALTLAALGGVASLGFAQPHTLFQGPLWAPIYALGAAVLSALGWRSWSERRALLPSRGTYLLPLDVLEVKADSITITPLGGVQQATIEGEQGAPVLVLTFEHGVRHAFPVASESDAEHAYEALTRSQEHLEALTRSTDIERAYELDPFFTLRGTGAQGQDARSWSLPEHSSTRGLLLAAGAGLLLGLGLWKLRNEASDQTLFDRARQAHTIRSYEDYLIAGQRNRADAEKRLKEQQALATLREENERINHDEELRRKRERIAAAFEAEAERAACEPMVLPGSSPEQAAACYQRRATKEHPGAAAWLKERILGKKSLQVALVHHAPPSLSVHLEEREEQLLRALRKIFADVSPPEVFTLERSADSADLRVTTRVTPGASPLGAVYVFDVVLKAPKPVTFTLTMPAARKLPALRPRSLYTVREERADEKGALPREVQLMSARAYDRLYDEVYGLFFDGAPRVPLQPTTAPEPTEPYPAPAPLP